MSIKTKIGLLTIVLTLALIAIEYSLCPNPSRPKCNAQVNAQVTLPMFLTVLTTLIIRSLKDENGNFSVDLHKIAYLLLVVGSAMVIVWYYAGRPSVTFNVIIPLVIGLWVGFIDWLADLNKK